MLGVQTQSQGSTAGLTMFSSRDYPYASMRLMHSPSNIHWSDTSVNGSDLSSWASSIRQLTEGIRMSETTPDTMATLRVEPADLPRLVDIEFAAFREEIINHQLSYRDSSNPAHLRRTQRTYRKYMNSLRSVPDDYKFVRSLQRPRSDSVRDQALGFKFRKVELPEGGEIIAFCKSEMTAMTTDELARPLDVGHEGESQMNRDWFALNERYHREYCGTEKHCYFGMLATHPDFQHRGAASMLMDELTAEADRAHVEIYCEATRTGRPLYEKYGFVAVKDIEFATAPYGTDVGVEHQTVMVRGALGEDGMRRRVRTWHEALAESAFKVS